MTREEFEQYAKENGLVVWSKEMSEKAIKALEQEPTTKNNLGVDCIDRNRAIERLKLNFPSSDGADNSRDRHRYMQALADLQAIRELPSATPQEPTSYQWCTDCKEYDQEKHCCHRWSKVIRDTVEEMKQEQEQEPKTGHWIEHPTEEDYSVCSRCGIGCRRMEHGENADGTKYIDIYSYRFCPYCGAKMVEPQESEDKE